MRTHSLLFLHFLEELDALPHVDDRRPDGAGFANLSLNGAGNDGARITLGNVELEPIAIAVLKIDSIPGDWSAGEDILENGDGQVARACSVRVSAASEVHHKGRSIAGLCC